MMDPNTHVREQTKSLHSDPVKRTPVGKIPEWMQESIDRQERESWHYASRQTVQQDLNATYQGGMGTD